MTSTLTVARSRRQPGQALLMAVGVYGSALALMWLFRLLPGFLAWQREVLGYPFVSQALALYGPPLVALGRLHSWRGPGGLGLLPPTEALRLGCTALSVLGPVSGLVFPLLGLLDLSPYRWAGGMVLAVGYGAALPLVALSVRSERETADLAPSSRQAIVLLEVLTSAVLLAVLTKPLTSAVPAVLYALLFVGLAEELLFRGYLQSKLNDLFGRPYVHLGVRWGWGLVVAALLFGVAHLLSPARPWQPGWALWTFVIGLVFGVLREKGGSFLASGVAHGGIMAIPYVLFGGVG